MWKGFAPGFFPLNQVIASSFSDPNQKISASVYHGAWFNIGDQVRLEELISHCADKVNECLVFFAKVSSFYLYTSTRLRG